MEGIIPIFGPKNLVYRIITNDRLDEIERHCRDFYGDQDGMWCLSHGEYSKFKDCCRRLTEVGPGKTCEVYGLKFVESALKLSANVII